MPSTTFEAKLDKVVRRHAELRDAMADPSRGGEFAKLSKEYSDLTALVEGIEIWQKARAEHEDLEAMAAEGEGEMKALAEDELRALDKRIPELEHQIKILLLPKDEADGVAGYISAARERLAKKAAGKARSSEQARNQADDQEMTGDKAERQPRADEKQQEQPSEPKFVANLRRRVEETDKIEDLETLESAERRIIDQQPDDIAAACDRLFRERRREIQSQ